MRTLHRLAAGAAPLILAGCVTALSGARTVTLDVPFDVADAERLLAPGKQVIKGSALMRQQGGGVVTCAGSLVYLVPATAYAQARMQAIYGNTARGRDLGTFTFQPEQPRYMQTTRNTRCDAQGHFSFENVAEGAFFVVTSVRWVVNYSEQGGWLMHAASTVGGVNPTIVLSP